MPFQVSYRHDRDDVTWYMSGTGPGEAKLGEWSDDPADAHEFEDETEARFTLNAAILSAEIAYPCGRTEATYNRTLYGITPCHSS